MTESQYMTLRDLIQKIECANMYVGYHLAKGNDNKRLYFERRRNELSEKIIELMIGATEWKKS